MAETVRQAHVRETTLLARLLPRPRRSDWSPADFEVRTEMIGLVLDGPQTLGVGPQTSTGPRWPGASGP